MLQNCSMAYIFLICNAQCLFSGKSLVKKCIVLHLFKNPGHIRKAVFVREKAEVQRRGGYAKHESFVAPVNKHQNSVVICASPPQTSVTLGKLLHSKRRSESGCGLEQRGNTRTFTKTKVSTRIILTSSQLRHSAYSAAQRWGSRKHDKHSGQERRLRSHGQL